MDLLDIVEQRPATRPVQCDWKLCTKSFSRKADMIRHYRIHTNDRPYSCTAGGCGKRFIQRSALTVHMRVHTGEKPHQCQHLGCNKRFSDSSSLARHRRVHTGRRSYMCAHQRCPKSFCRKATLVKHQQQCHQQDAESNNNLNGYTLSANATNDIEAMPLASNCAPQKSPSGHRKHCQILLANLQPYQVNPGTQQPKHYAHILSEQFLANHYPENLGRYQSAQPFQPSAEITQQICTVVDYSGLGIANWNSCHTQKTNCGPNQQAEQLGAQITLQAANSNASNLNSPSRSSPSRAHGQTVEDDPRFLGGVQLGTYVPLGVLPADQQQWFGSQLQMHVQLIDGSYHTQLLDAQAASGQNDCQQVNPRGPWNTEACSEYGSSDTMGSSLFLA